jgi:protocatechuate 3,4-dioxygenase beta subunit
MRTVVLLLGVALALLWVAFRSSSPDAPPSSAVDRDDRAAVTSTGPVVAHRDAGEQTLEPRAEESSADLQREAPTVIPSPSQWFARFLVVDEDERPVADAVVGLWAERRRVQDGPFVELHTDSEGRVEFLFEGARVVAVANKPGIGWSAEVTLARDGTDEARLELEPEHVLYGRVIGADGLPVAGAHVAAHVNGQTPRLGHVSPPQRVFSDERGVFELSVRCAVGYSLRAYADNRHSLEEIASVGRDPPPEVVLVFPGAITVRGIVLDPRGMAVEAARVRLWREGGQSHADQETASGQTDDDGRFEISVKRYARYQLVASMEGEASSTPIWITTAAERPHAEATLRLQRMSSIAGCVLDARGNPIAGVRVEAVAESARQFSVSGPLRSDLFGRSQKTATDVLGAFEVPAHPDTVYTLAVGPIEEGDVVVRRLGIAPGTRDLVVRCSEEEVAGCTVRGTVTRSDGLPPALLEVHVARSNAGIGFGAKQAAVVEGAFTLPPVPFGESFTVIVSPPNDVASAVGPAAIAVTADRPQIDLQFRLEPWAEVPVCVIDAAGSPVRKATVGLVREPRLLFDPTDARSTDVNGRVVVRQVPGPAKLIVYGGRGEPFQQVVHIAPGRNPEIVVRLPAPKKR